MASTTSPLPTTPKSPCTASAACRKVAGVPVLARVAAILRQMRPDLPMPVTMTLPRQAAIRSTARSKRASRRSRTACKAAISIASTRRARFSDALSAGRRARGARLALRGSGIDAHQLVEQRRQVGQPIGVGAVAQRAVGILVGLEEDGINADRH